MKPCFKLTALSLAAIALTATQAQAQTEYHVITGGGQPFACKFYSVGNVHRQECGHPSQILPSNQGQGAGPHQAQVDAAAKKRAQWKKDNLHRPQPTEAERWHKYKKSIPPAAHPAYAQDNWYEKTLKRYQQPYETFKGTAKSPKYTRDADGNWVCCE